jgi:nitrile hydratase
MNGIHDMGGMQHGFGSIEYDRDEGTFHEPWEGRAWAIMRAMGPFGPAKRKNFRYELEMLSALDYLRLSYYERLLKTMLDRLVASKALTRVEAETFRADPDSARATPRFTAAMIAEPFERRRSLRRDDVGIAAGYAPSEQVRARNINPLGHTRLPRYLRGKRGTIVRDNGVFNLQDTDPEGYALGEFPQHVYTVRFECVELWGPQGGKRDAVFADLWEDYLERP